MSNWVDLLPEILLVIAKKLISSEDFLASVAFGAVCTSWRSVYIKVKDVIKQLPTQVIWLMLAEERDHTDERGFFSLAKDVIYYNGNIYGVYPDGSIWVCDIEGYEPKATMLFHTKIGRFVPLFERMYLVESSGKLLAVLRTGGQARSLFEGSTIYSYGTAPFLVFELNISNRSCTRLESLENRALFVGRNSSISVNALNICGCKANSIYFTDDANESRDMGVWNMMDGRIETLFNPPLFCHVAPPLWVFPNFP
ncbi:F-box protein [Quillaja saponaria]|uniref:F-box protein n=1 Tax=Quillaja saponaria TaxID=32244 RepID=A0AAD7LQ82_QUISA|nr:F-box protein [Quillaja saponaria]